MIRISAQPSQDVARDVHMELASFQTIHGGEEAIDRCRRWSDGGRSHRVCQAHVTVVKLQKECHYYCVTEND